MNTSEDSSFFLFPLVFFFFFFSWIPSPIAFLFLLQSFFSSSSCPVISQIQGGYLSHQHLPLPFFDHENGLLGVFSLFKLVIQHLMWLHQVRRALNAEVTVILGSAFSSMYSLGKQVKKGDPRLSKWLLLGQATCSSGRQVSWITSVMGLIDLLSMEGFSSLLNPQAEPISRIGFLGTLSSSQDPWRRLLGPLPLNGAVLKFSICLFLFSI